MMNKIIIPILIILVLSISAYGVEQSLGTFKTNECVPLRQICGNCSYVNFTSVYLGNNLILDNVAATKQGSFFNYTLCNLYFNGIYMVTGIGDDGGVQTPFSYTFEVNDNGVSTSLYGQTEVGVVISIGILIFAMICLFSYLGWVFYKAEDMSFFFCFGFWYIALLAPLFLIRMVSNLSLLNTAIKNMLNTLYVVYMYFYFFMVFMLIIYFLCLVMGYLDWKKKPGWMKRQPV